MAARCCPEDRCPPTTTAARTPARAPTATGSASSCVLPGPGCSSPRSPVTSTTSSCPCGRRRLAGAPSTPRVPVLVLDLDGVMLPSAAAMETLLELDDLASSFGCEVRVVASTRAVLRPLTLLSLRGPPAPAGCPSRRPCGTDPGAVPVAATAERGPTPVGRVDRPRPRGDSQSYLRRRVTPKGRFMTTVPRRVSSADGTCSWRCTETGDPAAPTVLSRCTATRTTPRSGTASAARLAHGSTWSATTCAAPEPPEQPGRAAAYRLHRLGGTSWRSWTRSRNRSRCTCSPTTGAPSRLGRRDRPRCWQGRIATFTSISGPTLNQAGHGCGEADGSR